MYSATILAITEMIKAIRYSIKHPLSVAGIGNVMLLVCMHKHEKVSFRQDDKSVKKRIKLTFSAIKALKKTPGYGIILKESIRFRAVKKEQLTQKINCSECDSFQLYQVAEL